MASTMALSLPSPVGDFEAYLSAVHAQPLLDADEERELARRFREHGDLTAAWHLVTCHLRFVVGIARQYDGYGLPREDLVQEGNVGLMKAVKRFDPAWNVRLATFAGYAIRAEIHEYILRNWRIVKVATTKAKRKLFFGLRNAKKRLAWLSNREARDLAGELDVDPEEVVEMDKRLYARDRAFDGSPEGDRPSYLPPASLIEDWRFDPETRVENEEFERYARACLHDALEDLDERSRDIIRKRWLTDEPQTLQQLAERYGVCAERIRQIERRAIEKLRSAVVH